MRKLINSHNRKGDLMAKLGTGKRFEKLSKQLGKKGVEDPDALAASIGRKKYGKEKFQKMAARGKGKPAC
jgi:hypothetical protein